MGLLTSIRDKALRDGLRLLKKSSVWLFSGDEWEDGADDVNVKLFSFSFSESRSSLLVAFRAKDLLKVESMKAHG